VYLGNEKKPKKGISLKRHALVGFAGREKPRFRVAQGFSAARNRLSNELGAFVPCSAKMRFHAASSDREKSVSYQGMPSGIPQLTAINRALAAGIRRQRKAQPRERS